MKSKFLMKDINNIVFFSNKKKCKVDIEYFPKQKWRNFLMYKYNELTKEFMYILVFQIHKHDFNLVYNCCLSKC